MEQALRQAVDALEAPLRDGQAAGVWRDGSIETQALTVLMLIHGYAELVLTRRIRVAPARIGDYLATLLRAAPARSRPVVPGRIARRDRPSG